MACQFCLPRNALINLSPPSIHSCPRYPLRLVPLPLPGRCETGTEAKGCTSHALVQGQPESQEDAKQLPRPCGVARHSSGYVSFPHSSVSILASAWPAAEPTPSATGNFKCNFHCLCQWPRSLQQHPHPSAAVSPGHAAVASISPQDGTSSGHCLPLNQPHIMFICMKGRRAKRTPGCWLAKVLIPCPRG